MAFEIKKRFIRSEDLYLLKVATSVAMSPDEKQAAYTVETISEDRRKYFSHLHLADCKTGRSHQFTYGEVSDRHPVWSPDGKYLAFISTRGGKAGIYVIPSSGGAEKSVLEDDGTFLDLIWTPDGKELIYTFRYNDSHNIEDQKKKEPPTHRHITRLSYRLDSSGFTPGDGFHIWKVNVATGRLRQLTRGKYDEFASDVSPDGKLITFVTNRGADPDRDRLRMDLRVMPLGGGKARTIPTPAGPVIVPVFSSDSKMIAYLGRDDPEDYTGQYYCHVWIVDASGRTAAKNLIPRFDRMVFDMTGGDMGEHRFINRIYWSRDGKRIYFIASDTGSTHIFYAPVRGGRPTRVTRKKCHVRAFSLNGRMKLVAALVSNQTTPTELCIMPSVYNGDSRPRCLVNTNRKFFQGIVLPRTKEVWFTAYDGTELQGWLVTPPRFNPKRKYPAILEIHGGPITQYGYTFFHEMLWLASNGYVIFYTNPRGSGGRGRTFSQAIVHDWGSLDYADFMAAADYLDRFPFVNRKRMGVTGGSYGGFMTNWIIGHTNRFCAAVAQRSLSNNSSFVRTADTAAVSYRYFGGYPWDNVESYRKHSPLTYAKNVKTPLLIIHSENDLRCNIEQAEQWFATLKLMKKKVEFIRFPEESHGLSRHGRPDRRVARLEWILKWFDRYLK